MRNAVVLLLTIAALVQACVPKLASAAPSCRIHEGVHVVLYGSGDDPDVLAWDSRFRLREYHVASFDEAEQLLPHAVLEDAGTRAVVVTCVPGFVQLPALGFSEDAVGIVLLGGPDRGLSKWVLGSDARIEERKRK